MATARQIIETLLARYEPGVRAAFLESIAKIKSDIVLRVIVERLERGDINGAVEAMQIEAGSFSRLDRAFAEAYYGGGQATVDSFPRLTGPDGNRVVWHFGVRDLPSEDFLRWHSSTMVTRIVEDQREAIRQHLTSGLEAGRNPRQTALDVVGRVNRVTGRRDGGVIGLTAAQERYVDNARRELLSGDPAEMERYFDRARRDKRFDRTIRKAIAEGRPVDAATVERAIGRYSDRLLQLRGEMLARTETMTALGRGRDDAIRQQIEAGKIDPQDVTKVWRSAHDARVRLTHALLHNQTVEFDGVFQSASGAVLRYPGDPDAPASETIGCRCVVEYRVDYMASVVRRQRAA